MSPCVTHRLMGAIPLTLKRQSMFQRDCRDVFLPGFSHIDLLVRLIKRISADRGGLL